MSQANTAASALGGLGKFTELRQRLTFVLLALIVYRVGSYIPVPGVNPQRLLELMDSQKGTIVDMFNMFSGGALQRFSLLALNVVPYISSSIIVQLAGQIYAPWIAMKKEGESGRRTGGPGRKARRLRRHTLRRVLPRRTQPRLLWLGLSARRHAEHRHRQRGQGLLAARRHCQAAPGRRHGALRGHPP